MFSTSLNVLRNPRRLVAATTVTLASAISVLALQPSFAHTRTASSVSRGGYVGRAQRTLMSRGGGFDAPAQTPISGEVATVTADGAAIYAGREDYGQLLSKVDKDATIVVTGQTDKYYAVAMSNHTTGFIQKSDVELQNIQITTSGASDSSGQSADGQPIVAQTQNLNPLAQGMLQSAYNYLGVAPYVWGGNTIAGIDCSGFVKAVYSENGITLPRTAADQAKVGYEVPLRDVTQWQTGDRMYFECHHSYIDHTGMYVGNGYFIHSSINHHGVEMDKVGATYYWDHLVAVRRSSEMVAASGAGGKVAAGAPDFESNQE